VHNSTSATAEQVTAAWQKVLKRTDIGPEDNFFDLGGDPVLATQLFEEIKFKPGARLGAVSIFQAPTIAEMTALIDQPTRPKFPTIVPLRRLTGGQPLFVTHGLNGSVMELLQVVRQLPHEFGVYGLQLPGFDAIVRPFSKVQDVAEEFLDRIKEVQPEGPYALVGYSFGGLVMMEIARRLIETGNRISALVMIESYPFRKFLSLSQRMKFIRRTIGHHVSIFTKYPMRRKLQYLTSGAVRWQSYIDEGLMIDSLQTGIVRGEAFQRYCDATMAALRSYQPKFFPGKIRFVKAAKATALFPDDPAAVWKDLSSDIAVETVAGDHFGIITKYHRELGAVLTKYLSGRDEDGHKK
jgi:acetoacetyl-CoA synthetase